ncbi:unnamed protein product, partial [Cyprideis torosa]
MGNERRENIPARTAREFPGKVKIRKISLRKREITPDPGKKAGNLTMDKRTPSRAIPMLDHQETHTAEKPLSCSQCDARFSLKSQLTHNIEKKPFQCSHCDARFARKMSKVNHEKNHTGEKPFCCSFCGALFAQNIHLKEHETIHGEAGDFSCSYCDARFLFQSRLVHHERTHTGEKPFRCSFCDVRFARKQNLVFHKRVHTEEKPFCCSYCGARFLRSYDHKRHELRHTEDKSFSCSRCNARFVNTTELRKHVQRHAGEKPFSCSYCKARFLNSGDLTRHERRCSAAFIQKAHIVEHQRVHTGEKPFSCSVCDARFARKPNLQRHEKTHVPKTSHSCSHCEHLDHALQCLTEGHFKTVVACEKEGRLEYSGGELGSDQLRYERRFAPFSVFSTPPMVRYGRFIAMATVPPHITAQALYTDASNQFSATKKLIEGLLSPSAASQQTVPSVSRREEELNTLLKVAKTNS